MICSKSYSQIVLTFLIALLPILSKAQNACNMNWPASQYVVYQQAVSLNIYAATNTTIYPLPQEQAAITVTDAPTSFNTITTLTWTKTLPYTAFTSTLSSMAVPTATDSSFILFIRSDRLHQKRQSGFYMNANGTVTNDCSNVPIYAIRNGILTATINNTIYYYSTDPGIPYSQFIPSQSPGSITTSFMATSNGQLSWFNSQFYNGQAQFCSLGNGTVFAVFQQDAAPSGCMYIQLSLFSVSSCASLAMISGPSGPRYVRSSYWCSFSINSY
jgi:hypothetical protein